MGNWGPEAQISHWSLDIAVNKAPRKSIPWCPDPRVLTTGDTVPCTGR